MSNNSLSEKSNKSIESLSEDNIFTSQNTQSKSQGLTNIKTISKEANNNSNHNSDEDESYKNKILISLNIPPKKNLNTTEFIENNEQNGQNEKKSLALSLSPLKKGRRRRNSLIDIMEKSKKDNNAYRRSIINISSQDDIKSKDKISKIERKDAFGTPINKRNKRKIKVTFRDMTNNENGAKPLAEIIPIASFKKYNYIEGGPREEGDIITNTASCQCCLIY